MASYTYDPTKINRDGVDRMRFELGDTVVDQGAIVSPLCDEEYEAMITQHKDWRRAKIACLRAIVMGWAHEVDTSVSGLSYSLSQRYERWKKMLDEEEQKLRAAAGVPVVNKSSVSGRHYFYNGLHANPRRF